MKPPKKSTKPEWKDLKKHLIGGLIMGGTSLSYKTGTWKTSRPVVNFKKCIHCLICVAYCPENCIKAKKVSGKPKLSHIDYDYCKGCKICSNVCPVKCIEMIEEAKFHK